MQTYKRNALTAGVALIARKWFCVAVGLFSVLALATPSLGQTSPAWVQLSPTPDPTYGSPGTRTFHTAVYNPSSNRMIIFGGASDGPGFDLLNDVWVLSNADGTTGTPAWTKLTPSGGPGARELHQAAYDAVNNLMIIQGGYDAPGNCGGGLGDTWVLSNADGTGGTPAWTQLPASGPGLRGAVLGYDSPDNILILWGGQAGGCGSVNDTLWVLTYGNGQGGTGQWTQLSPANSLPSTGFNDGPGGFDPNTSLFIGVGTDNGQYNDMARLLSGAVPVPSSPTWTNLIPDWSTPEYTTAPEAGVYDPTTNVIITCCGYDVALQQLAAETWYLNYANGQGGTATWNEVSPSGSLPPARQNNSTVYNPVSDRMIIYGGVNANVSLGDVWVLVSPLPTTTTSLTSSANPSALGDTVTFTATVTSPSGVPTGSVTFANGGTALGTVALSSGMAALSTNSLPAGANSITAQYAPGASTFFSSAGSLTQNVISLSDVPLLNSNNTFTGNQTINGTVTANSFTGNLLGSATGLNCTGCVTGTQLGVSWALGDSPGGNAATADNALALNGQPFSYFAPAAGDPNYAPASGSANYVPISGGTLTGSLTVPGISISSGSTLVTPEIDGPQPGYPTLNLAINAANATTGVIPGGSIGINAGYGTGPGGNVTLTAGAGGSCSDCGQSAGGSIILTPGASGNGGGSGAIQLNGATTVSGNLTASSFTGDGSALTNVQAAALTSGATIQGSQVSGAVANATNAVTAASLTGNINDSQVNNLTTDLSNASAAAVSTAEAYSNSTFLPLAGGTLTGALSVNTGDVALANGNLDLPQTSGPTSGVLNLGGSPFLSAYGTQNTFVGTGAGNFSMSGQGGNTGVGNSALSTDTTGNNNSGFGVDALYSNTTGSYNTAVGAALVNSLAGSSDTAVGYQALNNNCNWRLVSSCAANNNTAVGYFAGVTADQGFTGNVTGASDTFLGTYSATGSGNLSNATAIGANALVGESNALVLGSINGVNGATSSVNVGIGTTTPQATLEVNGTAQFDSTVTFAPGQTFPGSGTITGITPGTGLSGGGTSGAVTLANTGLLSLTAGNGITSTGGQTPTIALNTAVTDARYLQLTGGTLTGSLAATTFSGNGAGLTALNPANLSAGTAGINISGNAVTATTAANAMTAASAANAAQLGGIAPGSYARLDIANSFSSNQTVAGNVAVAGTVTIGSGGTPIIQHLSALFDPSFPALSGNTCSSAIDTITGAVEGSPIALGLPPTRLAGGGIIIYQAWVSATNTVTLEACNVSASAQTAAGSGSIRIDLWIYEVPPPSPTISPFVEPVRLPAVGARVSH